MELVEEIFDELDVRCRLHDKDLANIPATGPVVVIANHPLGGLDGLALLKLIGNIRQDVKLVVDSNMLSFSQLDSLLIRMDSRTGIDRTQIKQVQAALDDHQAVIIFPAGAISKQNFNGIRDGVWHKSFLNFAQKAKAPLLPVHISGRNSPFYYMISRFNRKLALLLLPREMYRKRKTVIDIRIGEMISIEKVNQTALSKVQTIKLLRRNIYRLGKGKKQLFETEKTIIPPIQRQTLRECLKSATTLGKTADGKEILLIDTQADDAVMVEIGRLREIAFRQVGEGTGRRKDTDRYDTYYKHIIVWDNEDLEIAGAYRLAESWKWVQGSDGEKMSEREVKNRLYSASLFDYSAGAYEILANGIELGRSFVQPRYWGMRSLDYLWQGIGAYLAQNPQVRYIFGPASIPGVYPKLAQDMLIWYYGTYYADKKNLAKARLVYKQQTDTDLTKIFKGNDAEADFETLKMRLSFLDVSVPTLYKQYTDICQPGGMCFAAFNIDPDFNYCVDSLIVADISMAKPAKRKRYIDRHLKQDAPPAQSKTQAETAN